MTVNSWLLLGGGPSLKALDVSILRENLPRVTVMAIGDAIFTFPWAHILYASNASWWDARRGVPEFPGERLTQSLGAGQAAAARRWDLGVISAKNGAGLALPPSQAIHLGGHGGFQALNIALLIGGRRLGLIGYDYHPLSPAMILFRKTLDDAVVKARGVGVEATDLGIGGLLERPERGSLRDWLEACRTKKEGVYSVGSPSLSTSTPP